MDKLIANLETEFEARKENCEIIIEPTIPVNSPLYKFTKKSPDAIILKDNVFVIVELKRYDGTIIADCGEKAQWFRKTEKGIKPLGKTNPFYQAKDHMNGFLEFLRSESFIDNSLAPGWAHRSAERETDWLRRHVRSWVVTLEGTLIEERNLDYFDKKWFQVLPLDKASNALASISDDPLFNFVEKQRLLVIIKAKRKPIKEWHRGEPIDVASQRSLIPMVTKLMESSNEKENLEALNAVKKYDLKQHRSYVIRCWEQSRNPTIRLEALNILVLWQYELGKILNKALSDPSVEILDFALNHLIKDSYPETASGLKSVLTSKTSARKVLALQAIASSGHRYSGGIIYKYAKEHYFNSPFKKFQPWSQKVKAFRESIRDDKIREEFSALEREKFGIYDELCAVIKCLGITHYQKSHPWLLQILSRPTSLGYESDDYEFLLFESNYYKLYEATCEAIGKLDDPKHIAEEFFLAKLGSVPDDYKWPMIKALGKLGSPSAVPLIAPNIRDIEHHLNGVSINALTDIGTPEAFDKMWEVFIKDPYERSSPRLSDSLKTVDRYRFLDQLLQKIQERGTSESNQQLIDKLNAISMTSCPLNQKPCPFLITGLAETLFPLLKEPSLTEYVPNVLWPLWANKIVFDKALELTQSKDQYEKSGAIGILWQHYKKKPKELIKFASTDEPVEVRRNVVSLLDDPSMHRELYKFSRDEDPIVREYAFHSLQGQNGFLGRYYLVSETRPPSKISIGQDENTLCINFESELLFIPKKNLTDFMVAMDSRGTFGVTFSIIHKESLERVLIVPEWPSYSREESLNEIIRRIIPDYQGTGEAIDSMGGFWDNVPDEYRNKAGLRDSVFYT